MSYTIGVEIDGEFEAVVDRTVTALSEEGFGVLSDIDVAETFAAKLDLDEPYRNYRILGACNPGLAHEGLEAERSLGALLPCNVVVYEADDGTVVVEAVDPEELIGITGNPALDEIAAEVRDRLERALESL